MKKQTDSPGVYIPPPIFYLLFFLLSIFLQRKIAMDDFVFHLPLTKAIGISILAIALLFMITSLVTFFKSKNTLILIKPAASLQTKGIYNISRNPMYVGLAMVYLGITCLIGNWWNCIVFPLLIVLIQEYVIKREEKYLARAFGTPYYQYKKKVRRWL